MMTASIGAPATGGSLFLPHQILLAEPRLRSDRTSLRDAG
jgi:hypothetical protein